MFKSHTARGFLICLAVTFAVLIVYFTRFLTTVEYKTVDLRFQWAGSRAGSDDIVVVAFDDKSIKRFGRWPWPRSTHAQLVRQLKKGGAAAIAFDILHTEPDRDHPESDADLARAAGQADNVISASYFEGGIHDLVGEKPLEAYKALGENSVSGFVNAQPDIDGVTRHYSLIALEKTTDGGYYQVPSLAVAALGVKNDKNFDAVYSSLPIDIDTENLAASKAQILLNYKFNTQQDFNSAYKIYSYEDVYDGKIDLKKAFQGKFVFIGSFATSLYDLKAVPFASIYPGVFVHANALDNLLAKDFLTEMSEIPTLFYVLLLGLALGFVLPRLNPMAKLVVFVVVVAAIIGLSHFVFISANYVLPMVPPLLSVVGCYGGTLFYRLLIEEREKRKIKGSFKQYLSPKIIDIITRDPSKLKLGGEEREVTVFFLDIAGFTTMSEALTPTQLVEVMNQCLTCFSSVVLKHEGLINKYIGDCIMAFWNAPVDQKDHASQACLAALDCMNAIPALNKEFEAKGLPKIDARVGVNTGTVVVGNMGSHERFDYTVMGDPVNLASRLEGANKEYHSHIMVSDVTFEKAKEAIEARDLDLIRVKGKKEPRRVYEVLCKKGEMSEAMRKGRDKYHEALKLYRDAKFQEAIHVFDEVLHYLPDDHLTRKYLERARVYSITPPPAGWDGVFEMKSK